MRFNKVLQRASAASLASLASVPGARAADLPARQAAPIEYVRICDAYGAGFFFIPGTDSCLKVGGMVLTELRGFDPSFSISGTNFYANGTPHPGAGFVPSVNQYSNARSRDAFSFAALGRVELDTRTQSPWGALRAFVRADAYYGSGQQAATGSLGSLTNTFNTTAGTSAPRETTILTRAFIQFAGLTAGYAQSMFDFYANAYNFSNLRGSGATVGAPRSAAQSRARRRRRSLSGAFRRPPSRPSRRARGCRRSSEISASTGRGGRCNCRRPPIR